MFSPRLVPGKFYLKLVVIFGRVAADPNTVSVATQVQDILSCSDAVKQVELSIVFHYCAAISTDSHFKCWEFVEVVGTPSDFDVDDLLQLMFSGSNARS